ncbi:MAG: response regulator, partial [Bdellovibrionales bacterium]
GFTVRKNVANQFHMKEGLIGQCAFEKIKILLTRVPDDYIYIASSLGEAKPLSVVVLPVLFEGELKAVIELASFDMFTPNYLNFLDQLMDSIGVILNMISSSMRTEELLQELKRSNAELEAQANELEEKAKLLELKNNEVELASRSLEEKAEQLSLISKYKSEFLANMSHELRTPLNSLLILSKTLAENKGKNLTPEQVKFATTVYSAGNDLLSLINEILDLSKVEAGKMPIEPKEVGLGNVKENIEQTFRPVAEHKGIEFNIDLVPGSPKMMFTDNSRLDQILKNLLSNAFKFTTKGKVSLTISQADKNRSFPMDSLNQAKRVIAFTVKDTGIGIPDNKQKLIFEAFQQADGTTSRKYGGTGLGLTISREIALLLGGFIEVKSEPNVGSEFTLYLPHRYKGAGVTESTSEPQLHIPPLPENVDFSGKRILLVDDDMRNVFALTSVLESRGMEVSYAENGKLGVKRIVENPIYDLVLMDVMMPELDGIEATRQIREYPQFKNLPIISLTAKAMKGDREKCIAAGASDYITKPVDPQQLLSLMNIWLEKKPEAKNA